MNFDLQKNENENSHPQMHAVCRSGEKNMTNQHFEEFQETGCTYVLFQCCARESESVSVTIKATHYFSNVCCFFPNVWLCVRKTRGIKWTSGCFSKWPMTWCQLFFLQKHVQFTINKWNSSFCECFWWPARVFDCEKLMIFCVLELSDAFWKKWIFVDPFFQ